MATRGSRQLSAVRCRTNADQDAALRLLLLLLLLSLGPLSTHYIKYHAANLICLSSSSSSSFSFFFLLL